MPPIFQTRSNRPANPGSIMKAPFENTPTDVPVFEPDTEARYTLEIIAEITGVSSQTILHYQEQGLLPPATTSESDERRFNDETLRTLRRIEHLRAQYELNEAALKFILQLVEELERLRADLRSRR